MFPDEEGGTVERFYASWRALLHARERGRPSTPIPAFARMSTATSSSSQPDACSSRCESKVAVEDTAHGVAAAHAAGMRCIAIPNPFVAPEGVRHADLVLSSASQLRLADALSQLS